MKLNPLRFFKSLSARLLLLTLIWVSFIVTTIGYTTVSYTHLRAHET